MTAKRHWLIHKERFSDKYLTMTRGQSNEREVRVGKDQLSFPPERTKLSKSWQFLIALILHYTTFGPTIHRVL